MNRLWLVFALTVPSGASAEVLKIGDLAGVSIEANSVHQGQFQRGEKQGPGRISGHWVVKVGAEGAVQATFTRTVQSPAGTAQRKEVYNGPIGKPEKLGSTNFVWVLQEDSLVLLRAVEIGGFNTTFKLARDGEKWNCTLNTALVQET